MEPYSAKYGGLTLNMAINIRQQITMYSGKQLLDVSGGTGLNLFPIKADPKFYYTILEEFGLNDMHQTKLECTFDGRIEGGLGSSASAAVALIGAINKRQGLGLSKIQIAEKAWQLEVGKIGLFGGKQDQYAASLGGVNVMEFSGKKVKVTPLSHNFMDKVLPSMVLLYSGHNRTSSKIQENLKELTDEQIVSLTRLKGYVVRAIEYIGQGRVKELGVLMDEAWQYKKYSNGEVSNEEIDGLYNKALLSGAYGGKVLGSGGGGYLFFLTPPESRASFIQEMGLEEIDFSICHNGLEVRRVE